MACETTCTTGLVHIMGEITTSCYVDIQGIARGVIREIGYDRAKYGFDCDTCGVITSIDSQSPDIALGTNRYRCGRGRPGHDVRLRLRRDPRAHAAADQPGPQAGEKADRSAQERRAGLPAPDGKSQVTVEYDNGKPARIDAVVISTQHSPKSRRSRSVPM